MSKFTTTIASIPIPFMLPRRGRQEELDILTQVKVRTRELVDPVDMVKFCAPYGRATCLIDTPVLMAQSIAANLKLKRVRVEIRFSMALERMTVELKEPVFMNFLCGYNGEINDANDVEASMQVQIPVQVQHVQPVVGNLALVIGDPARNLTFEDLIDHLQKYSKATLYPLSAAENAAKLSAMLDKCLTPREILDAVQKASIKQNLGCRGVAILEHQDVYSMYQFSYSSHWRNYGK